MSTDIETRKKISQHASQLMSGNADLPQARAYLEQQIAANPTDGIFHYQLGTCLDRMASQLQGVKRHAMLEDSADAFKKASELMPEDFKSANMAAVLFLQLKKYDAALPLAERAVALRKNDIAAVKDLGRAYEGLGRTQDAIRTYSRVSGTSRKESAFAAARISALTA